MNIEACEQSMHYHAMGIHLALLAHKPESMLCKALEEAIVNQDWTTIQIVQSNFAKLHPSERALILTGVGHPMKIVDAIDHLEIKVYISQSWQDILAAREVMGLPPLA